MSDSVRLFSPLALRQVELKNRVMVSPMWQYCGVNGWPTDWHAMHLSRFAIGGAGLVMQEATAVERRGCGTTGDIGIWDDKFIEPLSRIVSQIRNAGAVPAIQLGHAGRKARQRKPWEGATPLPPEEYADQEGGWDPVAPSAIPTDPGHPAPRALETSEMAGAVNAWMHAARRADAAGYDVLEIHGAHGYLIHQFLSPLSNERVDEYGGSFENRCRFLMEIVSAVRTVWPSAKPLFVRLSCIDGAGWSIEDTIALVRMLQTAGVDMIDCTSGGIGIAPQVQVKGNGYGYQVHHARAVREATGMSTIAVGLIVHAEQAETILTSDAADLVALAREMLYNPNWPIDAAKKLGVDPKFQTLPSNVGYWLDRRQRAFPEIVPSTYGSAD